MVEWAMKEKIIMKELNKHNFKTEVLESALPVVVDVWGAW